MAVDLKALALRQKAATVEAVMPEIMAELEKMKGQVKSRAFTAIRQGKMTGDLAIQLWLETEMYERLLKRLNGKTTLIAEDQPS